MGPALKEHGAVGPERWSLNTNFEPMAGVRLLLALQLLGVQSLIF